MLISPDPRHFARAATELGESHPVVTHTAIFNAQGIKLVEKGVAVDRSLYERLTRHPLRAPLHQCLGSEPAITGAQVRDAAQQLCAQDPLYGAMLNEPKLRGALFDELSLIALPAPISFQLTLMHETQPEHWQHALRSAVTAAWLGARQGASRHDMRQLATAGLLHDLGMLHLDPALLQPEVALGPELRRQLYSHALVTDLLLEPHLDYPKALRRAVLEHHEAMDGSGYPRHLSAERISPWGRILGLTELVTAIGAHGKPAPGLQLSLILRMNGRRYDPLLVREVMQLLNRAGSQPAAVAPGAPLDVLATVGRLLKRWPSGEQAMQQAGDDERATLVGLRSAALDRVRGLCDQIERVLASTGVLDPQLALLAAGADATGQAEAPLADPELAMIAREACWQLRAASREALNRWQLGPQETVPGWLQTWLDEVDVLCRQELVP